MTGNNAPGVKPGRAGAPVRRVPQRTCIACRLEQGKRAFVRIVRTPEGRVVVDEAGRANGRGAYLCRDQKCWVKALKGSTINNALKVTPSREDVEALKAFGLALPVGEGGTVVYTDAITNPVRRHPGGAHGEGTQ
jgi:predicted RNA-binding protein YlxR (DUF448 family)